MKFNAQRQTYWQIFLRTVSSVSTVRLLILLSFVLETSLDQHNLLRKNTIIVYFHEDYFLMCSETHKLTSIILSNIHETNMVINSSCAGAPKKASPSLILLEYMLIGFLKTPYWLLYIKSGSQIKHNCYIYTYNV